MVVVWLETCFGSKTELHDPFVFLAHCRRLWSCKAPGFHGFCVGLALDMRNMLYIYIHNIIRFYFRSFFLDFDVVCLDRMPYMM